MNTTRRWVIAPQFIADRSPVYGNGARSGSLPSAT